MINLTYKAIALMCGVASVAGWPSVQKDSEGKWAALGKQHDTDEEAYKACCEHYGLVSETVGETWTVNTGVMPVEDRTLVDVTFQDGHVSTEDYAGEWRWKIDHKRGDNITKWRLHKG